MDFFDRHKALIITLLLFGIIFLGLYNFNLSNSNQKTSEMLIDLESLKAMEEAKETPPESEEPPQEPPRSTVRTHQAFNENQEERSSNFDQQLNEIFQKNSAEREETSENNSSGNTGTFNTGSKAEKPVQKRSDGNNTSAQTSTKSGGIRNTAISASSQGRTAVSSPNPVYTCDVEGKVVINISVDANGRVTSTSLNKASSTTTNECLIEQAMQYANESIFSSLAGRKSQPGTITYYFKP